MNEEQHSTGQKLARATRRVNAQHALSLMVSGHLGHVVLKYLLEKGFPIQAVFTNKTSEAIITLAQEKDLPLFVGNPRKGRASNFISSIHCDILLSVNYLFIIEKDLIDWAKKYAINMHGSLLPKYRGRTPHVWAIINGEKETGITAHLIDEKVDNGAIVHQATVPILPNETGADLLVKYEALYPGIAESVLLAAQNDRLQLTPQDANKAVYFGKRTPADGHIRWSWSKERIQNWIRAQANPYPGAFTYWNGHKIISHQSTFSDTGFNYDQPNGTILNIEEDALTVKTSNGALVLQNLQTDDLNWTQLETGMQLI